jgi:drug/metabolite transporter (DMT)-like permease
VETMLAWQQTGGLFSISLLLPFYWYYFPQDGFLPGWKNFAWLLVLSWVCSVIAFQLSANALKKLSAFTVNLTFNLEPVYGILLAFAMFNENGFLGKWFYIGFTIIAVTLIVHIIILIRQERRLTTNGGDNISPTDN